MARFFAVLPIGTPDDEVVEEASRRAYLNGIEPDGDISVEEHEVELGHLLVAYVDGTRKTIKPSVDVLREGNLPADDDSREVSTLDRPILWPKRKSTPGMLRSGSSGER